MKKEEIILIRICLYELNNKLKGETCYREETVEDVILFSLSYTVH